MLCSVRSMRMKETTHVSLCTDEFNAVASKRYELVSGWEARLALSGVKGKRSFASNGAAGGSAVANPATQATG